MVTPSQILRRSLLVLACVGAVASTALADDAAIRKNIGERLPDFPKIDEISKTPIAGLYEIRVGTEVFYTDEQGNHLIEGQMIDTKNRTNLTEQRVAKLTAQGCDRLEAGHGCAQAGRVRRSELRLLQAFRA
jgi:thiol:disulfide interchange protein DsbC